MAYEKHNFVDGDVLYAQPLNEMDDKIAELDEIVGDLDSLIGTGEIE